MAKRLVAWLTGLSIFALRISCRVRVINDCRTTCGAHDRGYVYASLHAHQIAATVASEPGCGSMISRSADAGFLVPALRLCRVRPIRGSSGKARKGGATALFQMIRHVQGGDPGYLAVDGPRGPRGVVQKGIAKVAEKTAAPVLPVMLIPNRRWVLKTTWDRMQLPLPFSRIDVHFGTPQSFETGETVASFASRIETALRTMEAAIDPGEAECGQSARSDELPSESVAA